MPQLSSLDDHNRFGYLLLCPKCQAGAPIEHVVNIPSPLRRTGRIQFTDGVPDIPMIPTIKAECRAGHTIIGPVEDLIEPTVTDFMEAVDRWNAGPRP